LALGFCYDFSRQGREIPGVLFLQRVGEGAGQGEGCYQRCSCIKRVLLAFDHCHLWAAHGTGAEKVGNARATATDKIRAEGYIPDGSKRKCTNMKVRRAERKEYNDHKGLRRWAPC
jgi:hypothetical protein